MLKLITGFALSLGVFFSVAVTEAETPVEIFYGRECPHCINN